MPLSGRPEANGEGGEAVAQPAARAPSMTLSMVLAQGAAARKRVCLVLANRLSGEKFIAVTGDEA